MTESSSQQPSSRPTATPSPSDLSRQRYGSASGSSYGSASNILTGRLLVVGIVLLVIVLGFSIFRQYSQSTQADVTATAAGFEPGTDTSITVTVDVTRDDPSRPAYCIVTALNYDKIEVGRREFLVPPSEASTQRFDVPVPTWERAVAGKPYGCSSTLPSFLK